MILTFILFRLISSFSKDNIKHALDVTVGVCIVYPDNSLFDIEQTNFQSLLTLVQGRFSFTSLPYSQYNLSDKSYLTNHGTNFVITREGKFLELYNGNFSLFSISQEINEAFYSYIEILNESSISDFKESTIPLFLLTGPSIIKEYEDAAFFYKTTKVRFGFLYQNSTNEQPFISLSFIDNKYNTTRNYDHSVPMIQFIRSCKTQKSQKDKNNKPQNGRFLKHSAQFVAITDNFTDQVQAAFDFVNSSSYGEALDFEVVSWENASELMKWCQIEKLESNLTYVLYPKVKKNQYDECYVFQDMDFYSKELLFFFVSKIFKEKALDFTSTKYNLFNRKNSGSNNFYNKFIINSFPVKLSQSLFSSFIPGKNLAFVFVECPDSFSSFDAKVIFNTLSNEFEEIRHTTTMSPYFSSNLKNNTNNDNGDNETDTNSVNTKRYLNPVDFYYIEYNFDNFMLPSADSFPTFVIYKPYIKQGHIFKDTMTIENVRNWILKFATEEEVVNETINESVHISNDNSNDFNISIKDLSIGNNAKHIDNSNDKERPINEGQTTENSDSSKPYTDDTKNVEKTIEKDEALPFKNLLNSLGFNLNFDEIKIITDVDSLITDSVGDADKQLPEANKMDNDEISKMIDERVKIEVKNLFTQEREKLKTEIINEIFEKIENEPNLTKRTQIVNNNNNHYNKPENKKDNKIINLDLQENKRNETKNILTNPPQNIQDKKEVNNDLNQKSQNSRDEVQNQKKFSEQTKNANTKEEIKDKLIKDLKTNEPKKDISPKIEIIKEEKNNTNDKSHNNSDKTFENSNSQPKTENKKDENTENPQIKEIEPDSYDESTQKIVNNNNQKENKDQNINQIKSKDDSQVFDIYQEIEEEL